MPGRFPNRQSHWLSQSRWRRPRRDLGAGRRLDAADRPRPLRRCRDFRLLFIGQGVSFFGSMVTYVALPYQAYRISHSSLIVGLLSLTELVPLLVTAFVEEPWQTRSTAGEWCGSPRRRCA